MKISKNVAMVTNSMERHCYFGGFKPIDEFTFDECFALIENNKVRGVDSDKELHIHYKKMLSKLQQSDDRMYRKATDIVALEKYIAAYPLDRTAMKYQLRHVSEAKKKIDDMTFASCKSIDDFKLYLSSFPSGRNVLQAESSIKKHQPIANDTSCNNENKFHNAITMVETIWEFITLFWKIVKFAIGCIIAIFGILSIYLTFFDPTFNDSDLVTKVISLIILWIVFVIPGCLWAFSND